MVAGIAGGAPSRDRKSATGETIEFSRFGALIVHRSGQTHSIYIFTISGGVEDRFDVKSIQALRHTPALGGVGLGERALHMESAI